MSDTDDVLQNELERVARPARKGRKGAADHLKKYRWKKGKSGCPEQTWQAGKSGNPGGVIQEKKPPGTVSHYLRRLARKNTNARRFAKALWETACDRGHPAHATMAKLVLEYTEGPPKQKHEVDAKVQMKQIQIIGLTRAELKRAGIEAATTPTLEVPIARTVKLADVNGDPGAPPEERPADPEPVNGHGEPTPEDVEEEDGE